MAAAAAGRLGEIGLAGSEGGSSTSSVSSEGLSDILPTLALRSAVTKPSVNFVTSSRTTAWALSRSAYSNEISKEVGCSGAAMPAGEKLSGGGTPVAGGDSRGE